MPLSELDPNTEQHLRRSPNSVSKHADNASRPVPSDTLAASIGVTSMLKTSTETGDLGFLSSYDNRRVPKPLSSQFRNNSGHAPIRAPSSHYSRTTSLRSKASNVSTRSGLDPTPSSWLNASAAHVNRGHTQHMYSSLAAQESVRSLAYDIRERLEQSERSMSLTQSITSYPERRLSNHRSLTSLKSAAQSLRPHSPLVRQGKLYRQRYYRPTSPALSDPASVRTRQPPRPQPGSRAHTVLNISTQSRLPHGSLKDSRMVTSSQPPSYSLYPVQLRSTASPKLDHGTSWTGKLVHASEKKAQLTPVFDPQLRLPSDSVHLTVPGTEQSFLARVPNAYHNKSSVGQKSSSMICSLPVGETSIYKDSSTSHATSKVAPSKGFVERVRTALEEQLTLTEQRRISTQSPGKVNKREDGDFQLGSRAKSTRPEPDQHPSDIMISSPTSETSVKKLTRELMEKGTSSGRIDDISPNETSSSTIALERHESEYVENAQDASESLICSLEDNSACLSAVYPDPKHMPDKDMPLPNPKFSSKSDNSDESPFSIPPEHSIVSEIPLLQEQEEVKDQNNKICLLNTDIDSKHATESNPPPGFPSLPSKNFSIDMDDINDKDGNTQLSSSVALSSSSNDYQLFSSSSTGVELVENSSKQSTTSLNSIELLKQAHRNDQETGSPADCQCHARGTRPCQCSFRGANISDHQDRSSSEVLDKSLFVFEPQFRASSGLEVQTHYPLVNDPLALTFQEAFEDSKERPQSLRPSRTALGEDTSGVNIHSQSFLSAHWHVEDYPRKHFPQSSLQEGFRSEHRFSISNDPNTSRFGLADLTEDSQEGHSVTNLRILGARAPMFSSMIGENSKTGNRTSRRAIMSSKQASSYLSKGHHNTLELPSLDFSRQDLTTKLNQALGIRSSRSLDSLTKRRPRSSTVSVMLSEQLGSADLFKERYRSFFEFIEETQGMEQDESSAETNVILASSPLVTATANPELLDEIRRLSIPSVQNLSLRLSALFPTLLKVSQSEFDLNTVDGAVDRVMEQVQELGSAERLASMDLEKERSRLNSASSLLFRRNTIQGAKLEENGGMNRLTEARLYLMKDLPPIPRPSTGSVVSSPNLRLSRDGATKLPETDTNPVPCIKIPTRLEANELHELEAVDPKQIKNCPRRQTPKGRLVRSPRQSREAVPPDNDSNHEAESIPLFSNASQTQALVPESRTDSKIPARGLMDTNQSVHRQTFDLSSEASAHIARSMSPGFDAALVPVADPFSSSASEAFDHSGKKNVLGNLARILGAKATTSQLGFPINPQFLHPEERLVDAGDRYPTTSLTTPSALTLDGRSYFSDDSSVQEEPKSFRKRITRLNFRRSASRPVSPINESKDQVPPRTSSHTTPWETVTQNESAFTDPNSNIPNDDAEPNIVLMYERPAAGMSKTEFRTKRIMEKLRVLWTKGGRVFRSRYKRQDHSGSLLDSSDAYVVR